MKKNPHRLSCRLFRVFLLYFVWNSSWHLPSQLIIKGRVDFRRRFGSVGIPVRVSTIWKRRISFLANLLEATVGSGVVRIRRIGKRHPAAKSADVWIKAVKRSEDDKSHDSWAFRIPGRCRGYR